MSAAEDILPGGVASDVKIVHGPNGPVVVKQALGKLKVAADWRSDPARSAVEVAALRVAAELIGQDAVPRVIDVDPVANAFSMTLIDPRLRNWKADLLAGRLDRRTAQRAGEVLGRWHAGSRRRPDLAADFADLTFFRELRIDPFFRRVRERFPDLGPHLDGMIDALLTQRTALVHGDFSPKNMLADGADLVLLDFEVAHWGNPRFDVAFLLAHLVLKRARRGAPSEGINDLGGAFVKAYAIEGGDALDAAAVAMAGALVLARTDGDSPADYLADIDVPAMRAFARGLITAPPTHPSNLFGL